MNIETYEVEEMKDSEATTMAADAESLALAEQLGLSGQLSIADTATLTRCPYREMTALESLVFKSLFPRKTVVERYKDGPIPLRVLQVLAHAKELPLLKRFEVWAPLGRKEPGPLLIAFDKENEYYSDQASFLLARWGDSLLPFEQLITKAKAVWLATAEEVFLTGQEATVSFNGWLGL